MFIRWLVTACSLGLAAVALSAQAPRPAIIDLGHPLAPDDPTYEGPPGFKREPLASFDKDGYDAGRITVDEHFGTHLDAPAHFAKGGWTVDRIPVDRLHRPGACIDVRPKVRKNADYQVTVEDIRAFETRAGAIREGSIVLIATGWDTHWPDRSRYIGERGGVRHFPGLSAEAVAYLARERRVAAIGIDTPSIDYGPSTKFEAHLVSMGLNVYHIENATRLTKLPPTGFTVLVAPINISGGSGAPARVFALFR